MQKCIFASCVQLLRQSLSKTINQPCAIQVRHGHARDLAIGRSKVAKRNWILKLPYLATSRNVEKEDAASLDKIVESKDGRVIACWHPEVPFPYEMSRPIPLDVTPTDSNLKLQALVPVREVFRKKHKDMVVRELMHLTYTSKHRWLCPPNRQKRLMKLDVKGLTAKRDREYL